MATWSNWENFGSIIESTGDGGPAWTDEADLENGVGDASHAAITNVGDYANRLKCYLTSGMFSAEGITRSHRLRAVEFSFQGRQGALLNQTDPNDIAIYWQSTWTYYRPPLLFAWPGTTFINSNTLAQWGFDTANDGVNAMNQLFDGDVQIRIRPKKVRTSLPNVSWVKIVDARIQYDLPVPDNAGILVGIL